MTIQIGDLVGEYKVIGIAGSGGMGAVYRIEHVITKRVEAMKLLPPGMSEEPEQVQRFEREIQVQARLHHPNIVALFNAIRHDNSVALIMEFVEGESLDRVLTSGALPLKLAVDYACQILSALAYAHQNGVIHRDVAPANIIITQDGAAKLTDFGLARAETDLRVTTTGVAVGSPWYMSPEQVRGIGVIDHRTDIYAVGAVLHEMLTGVKLFEAGGAFALMRAQVEAVPAPPSSVNPRVPPVLDAIVARALAKDQAERFQSADEFRLALEIALAPVASAPLLTQAAAPQPIQSTLALPPAVAEAVAHRRRLPHFSRAAVLMALAPALLLAAGYMAVRQRANARQAAPAVTRQAVPAPVPQPDPAQPAVEPAAQPEPATATATAPAAPATPTPLPLPVVSAPAKLPLAPAPAAAVAQRPAPATRPVTRQSTPQEKRFALQVTGADVLPAAAPAPSRAPATAEALTPSSAPSQPVIVEPPAPQPVSVAPPAAVPALESPSQDAAPAKPQKRNGLVRALGKINPFKKDDPAAPAQPAAKKN